MNLFGWKQCFIDKYDMICIVVTLSRDTFWMVVILFGVVMLPGWL